MRVRTITAIGLQVLSSVALLAQGQSDRPQFRGGVELVQLDVAVLDDKRQPVLGLTAADFTVLDNGVATPIRAFTPVELTGRTRSTEAVWAADVAPDVTTNQVGEQEGRLVVILMDRSIPLEQPTVVAKKIAAAAVDALGPHDLAAVVSTSTGAVQNVTSDRARLLRAINHADPSTNMSAEALAIMNKILFQLDPLNDSRCLCGLCVLETITRVADAVQDTPRRRKILFFIGSSVIWQSSGQVMDAAANVGCDLRLKDARAAMFASIDRANLTVHSIDPQGLVTVGPQTRAAAPGGLDMGAGASRARRQLVETTNTMTGLQSLQVLPNRTGGRTVAGRNNPEDVVPAIFRETEAYYVLGIERAVSKGPDRTRSIEVKVGRKGLRVVAQRQYAAPQAQSAPTGASLSSAPATAQDALNRLLPSAGLPLGLGLTAFASADDAKAAVRVNVDAGAFGRADGSAAPLDITIVATDATGRGVASARQTSTITVPPHAPDRPTEANVQSLLQLPPGDYGIRVAVSDPATGKVSSVFSDITIPGFDSERLSLSGVSVELTSRAAAAPMPTTRRVFRRDEQVRAVLQIYQGTERTDAIVPVSMRVQILDAKGSAVRDQSLPFAEPAFANRRADCVITLPLSKLPAGEYLLKLEASAGRSTSGRALRFIVE